MLICLKYLVNILISIKIKILFDYFSRIYLKILFYISKKIYTFNDPFHTLLSIEYIFTINQAYKKKKLPA